MSKHKHRHRHEEEMGNPLFDPNMLSILLLILGVFGKKEPIYNFDEELLNNQHNGAPKNGAGKPSDPGYTGGVLSKDNNSTKEAQPFNEGSSAEEVRTNINQAACEDCDSVFESEVVIEYPSRLVMPEGDCDKLIISVPVVLTQFEVEFETEAVITLDQPAQDIKHVKNNVFIEQCRLLPKVNKLFLGGVIRKNIEYGTEDSIRHVTVEVHFKCATEVQYFTPPVIRADCEQLEIETLRVDGMGADLREKAYMNKENFNDKIYCKLESDEINELGLAGDGGEESQEPECERPFETLTEKMVVKLNIKLVQEQEIEISRETYE